MVLRKLAIALLGLGVMLPGLSHALTVGPGIDVLSALGEPFHGQVALGDLGDLSSDDIKVALATQDDFDRFGIQKVYFLTDLRFNVVVNANGSSFIDVTSSKPVDEPVLDFVIHVSSPHNDQLKDMVALLDPPVQGGASGATVNQAQTPAMLVTPVVPATAAPEPQPVVTPVAPAVPTPAESAESSSPVTPPPPGRHHGRRPRTPEDVGQSAPAAAAPEQAAPATSYDVQSGDTLWVVAQKVKPSDSVTVPQTMIALQKTNPDAFIHDNINELKSGQTLQVPSESQIRDVSTKQALASVHEQNEAWRSLTGQSEPPAKKLQGQQVNGTASAGETKPAAVAPKAEMKLLAQEGSGKEVTPGAGSEGKGLSKADAKKLRENKLKAETAKRDNEKLASKVGTLDSQVKENDKKLAVENARLAELQEQLKEQADKQAVAKHVAPTPVITPSAPVAVAAAPAASAMTMAPSGTMAAMAASGTPAGVVASAAASAPPLVTKPLPETATVTPPPEESASSGLQDWMTYLAGGFALALVAFGGLFYVRHKKKSQAAHAAVLADLEDHDQDAGSGFAVAGAAAAGDDAHLDFTDDHEAYRNADLGSLEPSGLTAEVPMFRDTPTADPLDEVEQYLAYERYPQAVGFLNKAIAAQPGRTDLRLKLMEIYARLQDHHGFEEQETALADSSDLGVLARVEELKATMPFQPHSDGPDDGTIDFAPVSRKSTGHTDDSLPSLEELEMDFNATVSASHPNLKALDDAQLAAAKPAATPPEASAEELLDFNFDTGASLEDHDFTFQPEETTKSVVEKVESSKPVAMKPGLSFTLDEPEHHEELAPHSNRSPELDVSGMSLGEGIELADFETAPELAEPEIKASKASDDDLNFSLDDLETPEPHHDAPVHELHDALDGDFSLEETVRTTAGADEVKLDHVMAESGLSDMAAQFDDAFADHQAAAPTVAPARAPAPPAPAPAPAAHDDGGLGIDDEFDFLADTDENATKLDLAKAYIDMGDMEGAKDILNEVLSEGNSGQKDEAKSLLAQVG